MAYSHYIAASSVVSCVGPAAWTNAQLAPEGELHRGLTACIFLAQSAEGHQPQLHLPLQQHGTSVL